MSRKAFVSDQLATASSGKKLSSIGQVRTALHRSLKMEIPCVVHLMLRLASSPAQAINQ